MIQDKPEEKLMTAIFGGKGLYCYSYIVVEEGGGRRMIKLAEKVQLTLATLSLKEGKALELRFGLLDGKPKTLKEVGRELAMVTGSRAQQIVARALRRLRHPSRSRYLKQFLIPPPEEVYAFEQEIKSLREKNGLLNESNERLNESNERLKEVLKGCGVTEEETKRISPEGLASAIQALKDDRESLQTLISRFPNNRVWNTIRRKEITELSRLKEMVRTGEIRLLDNIGKGAEKFLKEVLQTTEKEASP